MKKIYYKLVDNLKNIKNVFLMIKWNFFEKKTDTIIIGRHGKICGIYSLFCYATDMFILAYEKGLNIYFDLKNFENPYLEEGEKGNPWEHFYIQKSSYPSENYMFSEDFKSKYKFEIDYWEKVIAGDKKIIDVAGSAINHFVVLNDELEEKINLEWQKIKEIVGDGKIIGVKYRATDYSGDKIPYGHPYQTTTEEMIQIVDDYCKKWKSDYIFLSVELQDSLDKFKEYFGEKCLFYDCNLISNYESGCAAENSAIAAGSPRKAGEDYIISIELLRRCNSLIASPNSGSIMAVMINQNKYENVLFIDKGNVKKVSILKRIMNNVKNVL